MANTPVTSDQWFAFYGDAAGNTYMLDTSNLSTETNVSLTFKAEDILANRVPTVRTIVVTYLALGPVTVTFTIAGSDDNGAPVSTSVTAILGTAPLSGGLSVARVYPTPISAFLPQLSLSMNGNAGSLYIATIVMCGTVEVEQTL